MAKTMEGKWLTILPPEGVPLELEAADLGERLTAFLVDQLLVFLALLLLFLLLGGLLGMSDVFLLAFFFVRQGYFFFFETAWNGLTPGKRRVRIRVVSREGGALSLDGLLARNLMRDLEFFLPLVLLLVAAGSQGEGGAWVWLPAMSWIFLVAALPFFSPERRRLGDLLGGTVVVRFPRTALLEDPAARKKKEGIFFEKSHLSVYGEKELEVLAEILRSLSRKKASRRDLVLLAETIAEKIGYEGREPAREPKAFLEAFYAAQRKHLEEKLLFGRRKASKDDKGSGRRKSGK